MSNDKLTNNTQASIVDTLSLNTAIRSVDIDKLTSEQFKEWIPIAREMWEKTIKSTISRNGIDPDVFYDKSMPQSELFMVEIIPLIHRLYFGYGTNALIEVLDIGPQTFSGTRLLSKIHSPNSFCNLKMKVSALDIHDKFVDLKNCLCPEVEFINSNVADVKDRAWDLVICSHVVEHVPNPEIFLSQIQELSRRDVIVACPWNENPITTASHVNTIDKSFVRSVGGRELQIFTNFNWGKQREVCIFTLAGKSKL